MLEPMASQPVLGTKGVNIYPYIRKIDLMSSNSYIISGEDQIALIDPGGLNEQIENLDKEILRLEDELLRPVVVYLTHVHLDHWIQLKESQTSRALREAAMAVQEAGGNCLEVGDSNTTLAGLLGRKMTSAPVQIKLLSALDKIVGGEHRFDIGKWSIGYFAHALDVEGLMLHSQTVPLGKDDQLEIFHIPGHSPDSVCLQVGSLLIIGDLFFAPNPGMAGAYGWSRRDFMESIQKVLWILDNKKIQCCLSGHGRPIDTETAKKTFKVMYRDAAALDGIGEISPEWAKRTSAYAHDLMVELERIFVIIAGRLAFIAHMLTELEEKAEAEEIISLLSAEQIDDMFSDFQSFAMELHAGRKLDWEMVHKTGQIVGKLDRLFEKKKLGSVIDQSLLRRAGRILSDYSVIYRGYHPPYYVEYVNVNKLIGDIIEQVRHNPHDDTAILDAESEEDYLKALKARIAHVNLFEDVGFVFEPDQRNPSVNMDRERFSDALIDILERFVAVGVVDIKIRTTMNDGWIAVNISGEGDAQHNPASGRSQRFFERNLSLCGALMQVSPDGECPSIEIEFYSQGDDDAIQF